MKNIEFADFPNLNSVILGRSSFYYSVETKIESTHLLEVT